MATRKKAAAPVEAVEAEEAPAVLSRPIRGVDETVEEHQVRLAAYVLERDARIRAGA